METRKSATKTSQKASFNFSAFSGDTKPTKSQQKKTAKNIEKTAKNMNSKSFLTCFLCLIAGLVIGLGAFFVVSRNDCFDFVGSDEITLTLADKYEEQGMKVVEFGKDISDQVVISSNLNLDENGYSNEVGTFYVEYTIDSFKYGKIFKIKKYRLVTFVESSEGGE